MNKIFAIIGLAEISTWSQSTYYFFYHLTHMQKVNPNAISVIANVDWGTFWFLTYSLKLRNFDFIRLFPSPL